MAIQKKSLIGTAASKAREGDGARNKNPDAEPQQPAKPAANKKLAVAKLATAKLSMAKLRTLRRLI
jgi:hypothetical protein